MRFAWKVCRCMKKNKKTRTLHIQRISSDANTLACLWVSCFVCLLVCLFVCLLLWRGEGAHNWIYSLAELRVEVDPRRPPGVDVSTDISIIHPACWSNVFSKTYFNISRHFPRAKHFNCRFFFQSPWFNKHIQVFAENWYKRHMSMCF